MANVGKNIRLIRKQQNMTQDALAELLYVSRQTVSNYETGRSNPDIDMLVRIAEALQTDVDVLIFGLPVSPSRRREYIKFGIAAGLLLALVFLLIRLTAWETVWRKNTFDHSMMFVLHMFFRPAVYLAGGWTAMQGLSLVWGIKRQFGKTVVMIYRCTVLFLALYLFLTVPYGVTCLYVSWQMAKGIRLTEPAYLLPEFWKDAAIRIWSVVLLRFPAVFSIFGLVLWNGRGKHRK